MTAQIKEALTKLDLTDDAQWTKDGLPLVGALGIDGLTRKDITSAAPYFTRENPTFDAPLPAPEEDGGDGDDTASAQSQPSPTVPSFDEGAQLEALRLEAKAEYDEAVLRVEEAKKDLVVKQDILDEIENRIEKKGIGKTTQQDIMSFIRSQHEQRMKRAGVRAQFMAVGFDPALIQGAPIDAAMSRKNQRGTQRPVRVAANDKKDQ